MKEEGQLSGLDVGLLILDRRQHDSSGPNDTEDLAKNGLWPGDMLEEHVQDHDVVAVADVDAGKESPLDADAVTGSADLSLGPGLDAADVRSEQAKSMKEVPRARSDLEHPETV